MKITEKRFNLFIMFVIFLCAFSFITVCSRCSFLYPLNDWVDANCFFTVGKSIANGKVLYKDIYEQKGLYLYLMHSIAYLINHTSFIGMYFFELAFSFTFGLFTYKILSLYIKNKALILFSLPIIFFACYSSIAFSLGDSAEEYIFPLCLIALYLTLKDIKSKTGIKYRNLFITGMLCSVVFFIKYTVIGLFIACAIVVLIFDIKDKKKNLLPKHIGFLTLGFFVAALPALIYFLTTRSLFYMLKVYIYDNIFVYTGKTSFIYKVGAFFGSYFSSFWYGIKFYVLILPSLIWLGITKKIEKREKALIFASYGFLSFFIFIGGKSFEYYGLPTCIFAFLFFVMLQNIKWPEKLTEIFKIKAFKKSVIQIASFVMVFASLTALVFATNRRTSYMKYEKDELMQYKIKNAMEIGENTTILNYGWLDMGIYTVCDIAPNCRYFCRVNMPENGEMDMVQDAYIENGLCEYIVCDNNVKPCPDFVLDKYEIVKNVDSVYLYKLKDSSLKKPDTMSN